MCKIKAININCKISSGDIERSIKDILLNELGVKLTESNLILKYNNDVGIYEIDLEDTDYFEDICKVKNLYSNLEFTNYVLKKEFQIENGKGFIDSDIDIESGESYYYINMPYENYVNYMNI